MFLIEVSDIFLGTRLARKFDKSCKQHHKEYKPKIKKEVDGE